MSGNLRSKSPRTLSRESVHLVLQTCSKFGIHREYIDQHRVAIVCSARSGSTKALGTTNLLIQAATEALRRRPKNNSIGSGTGTPQINGNGLFRGMSLSEGPDTPNRRGSSSGSASPPAMSPLTAQPGQGRPSSSLPEFNQTVDLIRSEHVTAAKASVRDPEILKELEDEIERDCDWLREFLFAAKVCVSSHPYVIQTDWIE